MGAGHVMAYVAIELRMYQRPIFSYSISKAGLCAGLCMGPPHFGSLYILDRYSFVLL